MSTDRPAYGCKSCDKRYATIGGLHRHSADKHPETITVLKATPDQMAPGLALLAKLRQFDNRNIGKPESEWVQGAPLVQGSRVRFRDGVKPRCAGMVFYIDGAELPDNGHGGRPYVPLVHVEDTEKAPSKRRTRNAYVDELVSAEV